MNLRLLLYPRNASVEAVENNDEIVVAKQWRMRMRMESQSIGQLARMKMELQCSWEDESRGFWWTKMETKMFRRRRNSLTFVFNNNVCLIFSVSKTPVIFGVVHEAL